MQAIRKRNPFVFQSEDRDNARVVLDEQGNGMISSTTIMCLPTRRTSRGGGSNQGAEHVIH